MFELKRKQRILEEVKMGDDILVVDLDPRELALEFNRRRNAVIRAERAVHKAQAELQDGAIDEETLKAYGDAFLALLRMIFGDKGTERIVAFFDGRYLEMTQQLVPFIQEAIVPPMCKAADALLADARRQYRFGGRRRVCR